LLLIRIKFFYLGSSNELLQEPVLRKHNLAVNHRYSILICQQSKTCGRIINHNFEKHLRDSHSTWTLVAPFERKTIREMVGNFSKDLLPIAGDSPVEGLLTIKGYKCQTCGKLSESFVSISQHHYVEHKGSPKSICEATFQQTEPGKRFEVFVFLFFFFFFFATL